MADSDPLEELCDAAALWLHEAKSIEPLVRAACDLLAEGFDGEALAELASISIHSGPRDIDNESVIFAALAEVGRPLPDRGSEAASLAAAVAASKQAVRGQRLPRDLARWAHATIGHDGPEILQDLVVMDDVYDCLPYTNESEADIDARTIEVARVLIANARRT